MAICRIYGKPDFFVTFTANPTWPEIRENLGVGEHATNRPDLVSRAFHLKLRELLRDLLEENVLGVVVAYTWTVEFQKRGPPHAHILLVVRPEDKPRAPELVDKVVSAELPDKTDPLQARLYAIVSACLLHGPRGACAKHAVHKFFWEMQQGLSM